MCLLKPDHRAALVLVSDLLINTQALIHSISSRNSLLSVRANYTQKDNSYDDDDDLLAVKGPTTVPSLLPTAALNHD